MDYNQVIEIYKNNQLQTAPAKELVRFLLEAGIAYIQKASADIKSGNIAERNDSLKKAQLIVSELSLCVNGEAEGGSETAAVLNFIYRQLIMANIDAELQPLQEAEEYLREILRVWQESLDRIR
ncbi:MULTISPECIES: flagellar export chaperone FliS [Bacillaceae]|uniref:flagellar export chaperone FliS n=1 Tax=Bacillaceae TaxID=186817 RepID=UPI0029642F75|nr:flagellar export chaperone FliS [Bacillus infantis]MDW2876660.1 flagellar export chaperone FliS [Bacillus infantis]